MSQILFQRLTLIESFISCNAECRGVWVLSGPKLLAALLAGHATPHAACPGLSDGGEHSGCV